VILRQALALAAVLMLLATSTRLPAEYPEYTLVWSDEFNADGEPDPASWTYEHGFVRNQELQWYQSGNAFCQDGLLVIEARHETLRNSGFKMHSEDWRSSRKFAEYTSALVTTRDRRSWLYGRFEIRARIRTAAGLWPAIWFLGVDGSWPANGEIDLMEFYAGDLLANAAWRMADGFDTEPVWSSVRKPLSSFQDDWQKDFHVWRMDWDEQKIALYVDDRLLHSLDVEKATNPEGVKPRYPFRQPLYLLLNLAIGSKGGDPTQTEFPARFEIDYVRVYQSAGESAR